MEVFSQGSKEDIKMNLKNTGYVTVTVSLLLCVMMIFILFVLEWIYVYMGTAKIAVATTSNSKSLFGNYHANLFQDYHLLMLDKTLATGSEASVEAMLQSQLSSSLTGKNQAFSCKVEDVVLTNTNQIMEKDFASVKEQIHAYSGYVMTDAWLKSLKSRAEGVSDYQKEESGNTEQTNEVSQENLQDPRGFFKDLTGKLLLQIVCPKDMLPSDKTIDIKTLPSGQAGVKSENNDNDIDFASGKGVEDWLGQSMFDWNQLSSVQENVELAFYVSDCFRNVYGSDLERSGVLLAEQEYILYGKESDQDNVIAAIKGIILLRFPFNYACLKQDLAKQGLITTAAAILSVVTKSSVSFMTTILTGAICYGEGMLDVKALLEGEAVPLVKNKGDWRLDISSFLLQSIQGSAVDKKDKGLCYQDYLTILTLLHPDKAKLYYRILDVITLNIRREEDSFSFAHMITEATVQYRILLMPRFCKYLQRQDASLYTIYESRTLQY